jgi:hypothetical protein
MIKNKLKYFTINDYNSLIESGMFWELYPEATGYFDDDVQMSINGEFKIEQT